MLEDWLAETEVALPADTYQLTIGPDASPDDNADGDLDISGTLEIQGAGEGVTFIQAGASKGNGIDRIFHIVDSNASLTLSGLTVRYGTVYGGGIHNQGELTIQNTTVSSNTVVGQDAPGVEGRGGGVYSSSQLHVLGSTIKNNPILLDGSMVADKGELSGGGIYNEGGNLAITDTQVISNSALHTGGGVYSAGGTLSISATQVVSNSARGTGGIYLQAGSADIQSSSISSNTSTDYESGGIKTRARFPCQIAPSVITSRIAAVPESTTRGQSPLPAAPS